MSTPHNDASDTTASDAFHLQAGSPDLALPRINHFAFRRGTLTANQEALYDEVWPELGKDLSDEVVNTDQWFGRAADLVVEIGCGTGTSTVAMAAEEPDVNVIAVEVYKPGLAKLIGGLVREDIHSVRCIKGDGVKVLTEMIAPESVTGVRVFFPDPWPKARHQKRRLLQPGVFRLIASRLKPGGVLHVASDHAGYAEWIEAYGDAEPNLQRLEFSQDNSPILLNRQVTKFEQKGLDKDHVIAEFLWQRPEGRLWTDESPAEVTIDTERSRYARSVDADAAAAAAAAEDE